VEDNISKLYVIDGIGKGFFKMSVNVFNATASGKK
jgi:hypothetical protein